MNKVGGTHDYSKDPKSKRQLKPDPRTIAVRVLEDEVRSLRNEIKRMKAMHDNQIKNQYLRYTLLEEELERMQGD